MSTPVIPILPQQSPSKIDVNSTTIILLTNSASKTLDRVLRFQKGHRFQASDVPEWPELRNHVVCQVREDREDRRLYLFVKK